VAATPLVWCGVLVMAFVLLVLPSCRAQSCSGCSPRDACDQVVCDSVASCVHSAVHCAACGASLQPLDLDVILVLDTVSPSSQHILNVRAAIKRLWHHLTSSQIWIPAGPLQPAETSADPSQSQQQQARSVPAFNPRIAAVEYSFHASSVMAAPADVSVDMALKFSFTAPSPAADAVLNSRLDALLSSTSEQSDTHQHAHALAALDAVSRVLGHASLSYRHRSTGARTLVWLIASDRGAGPATAALPLQPLNHTQRVQALKEREHTRLTQQASQEFEWDVVKRTAVGE